jgi:hypothetical protein
MTDVEQLLTAELEQLGGQAPHDPDLAGAVRRRARRQVTVLGSVLAVLVLLGGAGFAAAQLRGGAPTTAASMPPPADTGPARACAPLSESPLPVWARTGFSDPEAPVAHTAGRSGLIVAIPFGPLKAAPDPGRSNKVLWAAKAGGGTPGHFTADARLAGSTRPVHLDLGLAPGPSTVDLPAPGCWQLDLRWGDGYRDTVSLQYG